MSTWYSACLVFRSVHSLPDEPTTLWEAQVLLLRAEDLSQAEDAARRLGREREHEYEVSEPRPHTVRWQFVCTIKVQEVLAETLEHGSEVFSRFLGPREAQLLLDPPDEE